jgi:predicted ribosome quality control (RQC) complex YloA/Tae2 family protein
MKKEMSSFDVRSIVSELSILENAHMDKIFQWGSGNVLFRINAQGPGKKDLFFKDRKWLYLAPEKPETPITPTSFATFLRKYIDNARVGKTVQAGFDRVVIMEVFKADAEYKLIFEMFGGGNVLLVLDGKIVNCLIHKTYRDRSTRPGEDYVVPKERFNPLTASSDEFKKEFTASESDTVRTLATVINLGGQYAEEVCKRSGIAKNTPQSQLTDGDLDKLYEALHKVIEHVIDDNQPTVFLKDGKMIDLAPVYLSIYDGEDSIKFDTISLAVSAYLKEVGEKEEEDYVDPEMEKLEKRIGKQQETVDEYRMECEDLKKHADVLYTEYQKVTGLLSVLKEQSQKLTWDKLKEGAMKIPYVKNIDPSKNTVTAVIGDLDVTMDYTQTLDANASNIYTKSKDIGEKSKRAEDALKESRSELEKKLKGINKAKAIAASRAQPTKQFWFERYKWFITTAGKLVLAGRDTHTNDNVVKKHLKEGDVFAHADVHGAPSVILKEGKTATPEELRETCTYALAQSKSWIAVLSEGTAFWVYPDQVSKTPNPGEFVPRGAFIVRGKRNYEHHLDIELGIGEIDYEGSRKIMCGPVSTIEKCTKYMIIRPGREKSGRMAGDIAKEFQVPEEEISRILPPGDVKIIKKVWPQEGSPEV